MIINEDALIEYHKAIRDFSINFYLDYTEKYIDDSL